MLKQTLPPVGARNITAPIEHVSERSRDALLPKAEVMSGTNHIAQRVLAFLQKRNAAYCEACLVERLLVASRTAMKAALEMDCFSVRIGVCPDCKTRKQVIDRRTGNRAGKAAA